MTKQKSLMAKLMGLMLAVVMALAMVITAVPAMAYTKDNPGMELTTETHTYKAYQIFTADSVKDGTYTNLAWAENVTDEAKTALKTAVGADTTDVDAITEKLGTDNDSIAAVAFAKAAYEKKGGLANVTDVVSGTTKLKLGYWVIVDETTAKVKAINRPLLVASDGTTAVTIVSKVDYPTSTKKVQDINDSDGKVSGWQDSADYDVNDPVPFKLTATIPGDYDDYNGTYHFTFHDKQCDGLDNDVASTITVSVIKKDETTATPVTGTPYTVNGTRKLGTDTFDIEFSAENLIAMNVAAGDTVVVEYTAKLNANAVHGRKGNPNESYITYNNDCNSEGAGKPENGETPKDTVIVFTYDVITNKVKQDRTTPLEGAGFTLYKKVSDTNTTGATKGSDITFDKGVKHTAIDADTYYVKIVATTQGDKPTSFKFSGIDDGDYVLVETAVPAGYSAWESKAFKVTATHTATSDSIAFDTGKDNDGYILTALDGGDLVTGQENPVTLDDDHATIATKIVNEKQSSLPTTGGIGTTIFYVVGIICVLGAGIALVVRRKMER